MWNWIFHEEYVLLIKVACSLTEWDREYLMRINHLNVYCTLYFVYAAAYICINGIYKYV